MKLGFAGHYKSGIRALGSTLAAHFGFIHSKGEPKTLKT